MQLVESRSREQGAERANVNDSKAKSIPLLHLLLLDSSSSPFVSSSLLPLATLRLDLRDASLEELLQLLSRPVNGSIGRVVNEAVAEHLRYVGLERFDGRVGVRLEVLLDRAQISFVALADDVVVVRDLVDDEVNLRGGLEQRFSGRT